MKYRSKETIEAIQWTGKNFNDIVAFSDGYSIEIVGGSLHLANLSGAYIVDKGSWIAKKDDEISLFTDDNLNKYYEKV